LCLEVGDEACWGVYEAILRRYPEALNNPLLLAYHGLYNKELKDLPESILKSILRNLDSGMIYPTPATPYDATWDGVAAFGAIHAAEGWIAEQVGIELLFNFHSLELTLSAVVGFGGGVGAAATGDGSVVFVYNIGDNNLNYSGDFVSVGLAGAAGAGANVGYSITPRDIERRNFFNPEGAFSISVGCAAGVGGAFSYTKTDYIPVITTNLKTNEIAFVAWDYITDPNDVYNNGFVTGTYQRVYKNLEEYIDEYIE
jgi:hypothetical protein